MAALRLVGLPLICSLGSLSFDRAGCFSRFARMEVLEVAMTLLDSVLVVAVTTAGLVAGQMLAIGLANHADRAQAASEWIRRFQLESGLFSKTMPPAMAVPILCIAVGMFLSAGSERIFLGVALALMAAALAITLSVNVPINGRIQSWPPESPPLDWANTRDRWLRAHWVRTAIAVVGLVVVAVAKRLG